MTHTGRNAVTMTKVSCPEADKRRMPIAWSPVSDSAMCYISTLNTISALSLPDNKPFKPAEHKNAVSLASSPQKEQFVSANLQEVVVYTLDETDNAVKPLKRWSLRDKTKNFQNELVCGLKLFGHDDNYLTGFINTDDDTYEAPHVFVMNLQNGKVLWIPINAPFPIVATHPTVLAKDVAKLIVCTDTCDVIDVNLTKMTVSYPSTPLLTEEQLITECLVSPDNQILLLTTAQGDGHWIKFARINKSFTRADHFHQFSLPGIYPPEMQILPDMSLFICNRSAKTIDQVPDLQNPVLHSIHSVPELRTACVLADGSLFAVNAKMEFCHLDLYASFWHEIKAALLGNEMLTCTDLNRFSAPLTYLIAEYATSSTPLLFKPAKEEVPSIKDRLILALANAIDTVPGMSAENRTILTAIKEHLKSSPEKTIEQVLLQSLKWDTLKHGTALFTTLHKLLEIFSANPKSEYTFSL